LPQGPSNRASPRLYPHRQPILVPWRVGDFFTTLKEGGSQVMVNGGPRDAHADATGHTLGRSIRKSLERAGETAKSFRKLDALSERQPALLRVQVILANFGSFWAAAWCAHSSALRRQSRVRLETLSSMVPIHAPCSPLERLTENSREARSKRGQYPGYRCRCSMFGSFAMLAAMRRAALPMRHAGRRTVIIGRRGHRGRHRRNRG